MSDQPPTKKARLEASGILNAADVRSKRSTFLNSLSRPVSPPAAVREISELNHTRAAPIASAAVRSLNSSHPQARQKAEQEIEISDAEITSARSLTIPSPFQLTRIRGLPPQDNVDTVSLHDILGDPLISEAWIFNFCFDVSWIMRHFDEDVRSLVKVKIVHGSWKREDGNRQGIEEDMKVWKNVEDIRAFLPDPFGTHHSKMMILFKHDSTAQVIIHTANMLEKDWDHMTQAVWRSPMLPSLVDFVPEQVHDSLTGSGPRFKSDLLRYIKAYGKNLNPLRAQLSRYDFSEVRAALVASVPSRAKTSDPSNTIWGHLSLRAALEDLKLSRKHSSLSNKNQSHLISQVSSIATLPQSYLQETLYKAASASTTSIIYPCPADLRSALTGYATGGSIHTKTSSAANQKQVSILRPQFHRWGLQSTNIDSRAGRHMIPPHIKTYINFTTKPITHNPRPDINWALLTSANLSQQAWGSIPKKPKSETKPTELEVHIQSFEIGVLIWPELFAEEIEHDPEDLDGKREKIIVRMVPVFGNDLPREVNITLSDGRKEVVVGLRMPYDLPSTPYGPNDMPWSPNERYLEPDRLGNTWP